MLAIIAIFIFILSLLGVAFMILRKIPVLIDLPIEGGEEISFSLWKRKFQEVTFLKNPSLQKPFKKVVATLSTTRIKRDKKLKSSFLESEGEKQNGLPDNYWETLRSSDSSFVPEEEKKVTRGRKKKAE